MIYTTSWIYCGRICLKFFIHNSFNEEQRRTECQCKWLIDYLLFYVPLKNFSLTIAGEGLQNLGLCSALRAFE
jgi:hypothetical protein